MSSSSSMSTIEPNIPPAVTTSSPTSSWFSSSRWARIFRCWGRIIRKYPTPTIRINGRNAVSGLACWVSASSSNTTRPPRYDLSGRQRQESTGPAAQRRRAAAPASQRQGARSRDAEMTDRVLGGGAPAGRPLQESKLEQVRLDDVLDRVGLLADRGRQGGEPHRPS